MEFEWDTEKAEINDTKHQVSFQEAATIFGDPLAITYDDPDLSTEEYRWITFGRPRFDRLLVVSHTQRKGKMRIISARLMTKAGGWGSIICGAWNAPYENPDGEHAKLPAGVLDGLFNPDAAFFQINTPS